jgi:tetratricopeptide (TPR) repeat protein
VALTRYGALALQQNDFDAAQGLLEEALELHTDADEPEHKAETLNGLAMLALSRGDLPAARRGYEEALRLNQAEGSTDLTPVINLGWLAIEMGDPRGAEALFEEVESSTEELTEEELAWSLLGLGVVSWLDGDLTRAADRFDECARILEELEAKPALVYGVLGQALVALDRDEPAQAADRVRRTAELAQGLGGGERYNVCLDTAVLVLAAEKKLYQAAWLAGATQSLRDRHQWPLFRWFADHVTEVLADVRTQLGPDRFERAWAEGETATIGQALRFVLVET